MGLFGHMNIDCEGQSIIVKKVSNIRVRITSSKVDRKGYKDISDKVDWKCEKYFLDRREQKCENDALDTRYSWPPPSA